MRYTGNNSTPLGTWEFVDLATLLEHVLGSIPQQTKEDVPVDKHPSQPGPDYGNIYKFIKKVTDDEYTCWYFALPGVSRHDIELKANKRIFKVKVTIPEEVSGIDGGFTVLKQEVPFDFGATDIEGSIYNGLLRVVIKHPCSDLSQDTKIEIE